MQPLNKRTAEKSHPSAFVRASRPRLRRSKLRTLPHPRAGHPVRSAAIDAAVERLRAESIAANPYEDYAIDITPDGGMRMTFKVLDNRLRRKVVAIVLWVVASAADTWVIMPDGFQDVPWPRWLLLIIALVVNILIVIKPFEMLRSLEVRADVMIIDGQDFFMRHRMEGAWPSFQPDQQSGELVLSGIYGTRQIEYLRVGRLDEFDRAPEVLMAHLRYAMQQLWTPQPY